MLLSAIEPYIYFGNEDEAKWTLGTALKKGKHSAFFRYGQVLMPSEAYQYGGSPAALLVKYSLKFSDNLLAGFAFEKDAGEKGIDFFSGYIDFGNGISATIRKFLNNGLWEHIKRVLVMVSAWGAAASIRTTENMHTNTINPGSFSLNASVFLASFTGVSITGIF